MPCICSARAKRLSTTVSYQTSARNASQVCNGVFLYLSNPQKRRELWPENYVGGEEMAAGRGTDINRISYLLSIALIWADLMGAKWNWDRIHFSERSLILWILFWKLCSVYYYVSINGWGMTPTAIQLSRALRYKLRVIQFQISGRGFSDAVFAFCQDKECITRPEYDFLQIIK